MKNLELKLGHCIHSGDMLRDYIPYTKSIELKNKNEKNLLNKFVTGNYNVQKLFLMQVIINIQRVNIKTATI